MNNIWKLSTDDCMEFFKRCNEKNITDPKERMKEFAKFVEEKQIKPAGLTELTREEWIKEAVSKGNNLLSVENEDGKTLYKFYKPLDKE